MIKGDRIKLVKPMGVFTNIGEICEVVDVAEGGVISFRFGGCHLGCMSYDEYLKYFESVIIEEKKPRVWTEWKSFGFEYYDLRNELHRCFAWYKHNGKRIKVKSTDWEVQAETTCHYEDEFDFEKGLNLAQMRLIVKILDKQVNEIAKGM